MVSNNIGALNSFLSSVTLKKKGSDTLSLFYFVLLSECGLTRQDLIEAPIPFLIGLINSYTYVQGENIKAMKKH